MTLTEDQRGQIIAGAPFMFEDVCFIYPAIVKDILTLGYTKFLQYLNIMTLKKPTKDLDEEQKQFLDKISDFDFFLIVSTESPKTYEMVCAAFQFFTKEQPTFMLEQKKIVVGPINEQHILNEENFFSFQSTMAITHKIEEETEDIRFLPTDSPKIREIKQKMLDGRKMLAEKKAKQRTQETSGASLSFIDLVSSLPIGLPGYSLQDVLQLSYFAFHDLLKRLGWREEFDMNSRAALAGAKIKPGDLKKHWIRAME